MNPSADSFSKIDIILENKVVERLKLSKISYAKKPDLRGFFSHLLQKN